MIQETIQPLLAPVVLISSCGLLCLAQYNRLAGIVARARAFHQERLMLFSQLRQADCEDRAALTLRFEHDRICALEVPK